jgi:hypothetical protein
MEIEKAYYPISEILERWHMPERDLTYLAENDELRLSVRVFDQPLLFNNPRKSAAEKVSRGKSARKFYSGLLDLWAGDAFELHRCGELHLGEFRTPEASTASIYYMDSPIFVMIGDLLVRREERDRFESVKRFSGKGLCPDRKGFSASTNYQNICCSGRHFHLGPIQAEVVRALHEAALAGDPWKVGKVILAAAGSRSLRMSDVFKSQKFWRELILSDSRGKYRINCG